MKIVAAGLLFGLLFAGLAGCNEARAQAPNLELRHIPLDCESLALDADYTIKLGDVIAVKKSHDAALAEVTRLTRENSALKSTCTAKLEVIPPAPRPKPKPAPGTVSM